MDFLNEQQTKDTIWIVGSFTFVLIYVSIHMQSFFMGAMSMLAIVFSFPITLCIYKLVFMIDYFAALQIVAVFIILGISADNFFVFADAWE
jgi:hypothetical protein